jgi:CRISPR-associated endoribonuclease Cas6
MCKFKIKLPEELMRVMYEGGIGEKGSLGFGMARAKLF